MIHLAWLLPLFPLVGFLLTGLGQKYFRGLSAGVFASAMVLLSFLLSCSIFFQLPEEPVTLHLFNWISSGSLVIPFSFLIDRISIIMLLIITGVGFLIHVYSIGYMKGDAGYARFFSYLNLFIFFMLLLVLGADFIVLFAGWEGVGLCSYLLIGFWFKNTEYNNAANKAFIMNRIGDLGFLLGIILIYITFGSTSFNVVFPSAVAYAGDPAILTAITLLLFIGAMGKSAQIPLYTWLPDAMAGPTPVSALIHAATMVTAGIYMIVRSNILYSLAPFTLDFVAVIGTVTAIFAALIAMAQTDIKKVLAYSTVSQLGYMFVALGAGAYSTALFHVTTHAFFKALLFLAAGSVIHAMSGEQNISRMGGLRKKLPVTFMVFLIGTLAISGFPPFAGFFSKDEILALVWVQHPVLFVILSITSVLTAVYMFRVFFLTFYGKFRGSHHQEEHLHESPPVMTFPLIVLAVLSAIGGFMGLPEIFSHTHLLNNFLEPLLSFPVNFTEIAPTHSFEWKLIITSVIALAILIPFAYRRYAVKQNLVPDEAAIQPTLVRYAYSKFYIDELYDLLIVKPLSSLGKFFYSIVDIKWIDGLVNSVSKSVKAGSGLLRLAQTGHTGYYIFIMVFGIIAMIIINSLT
jgi:NADH-quinone oxidoreductase subunit L